MHTETIISLETELAEAMKSADVAALDRLLHNELTWHLPFGQRSGKAADLAAYASGDMKVEDITVLEQELALLEGLATVSARIRLKGAWMGNPIDGVFLFLRVWHRTGDQWQVVAGSSHAITE